MPTTAAPPIVARARPATRTVRSISVRFLHASPARSSRRSHARQPRAPARRPAARTRGDRSATCSSTSTATPVVLGSSAAAIAVGDRVGRERADADVVAARAQLDANGLAHRASTLRRLPHARRRAPAAAPSHDLLGRRAHRSRRARARGRRTAAAPRAALRAAATGSACAVQQRPPRRPPARAGPPPRPRPPARTTRPAASIASRFSSRQARRRRSRRPPSGASPTSAQRLGLALPEPRLPLRREDLRDRLPGRVLDDLVQVDERPPQALGQQAARPSSFPTP